MVAIVDDFERADSGTLGANYTAIGAQSLEIVSGDARHNDSAGTSSGNLRTAETFANDQYAIGVMAGKTANAYWTIYVRADSTADNSYFVAWGGGSNDWYLNKKIGGSESTLKSGTRSWANGDELEVRVTGTTVEFYHNSVLVDSATDTSHTSGDPGLEIYRDAAGSQGFSAFEAGDIGGNVTLTVDTAGAITVAGQAVTFARALSVSGGAISIAGSDVTLNAGAGTTLSVDAGAITIAGQSIAMDRTAALSPGALTVEGQSLALNQTAALLPGAITLSGQDHWFEYAVPWDPGAITIAGQPLTANVQQAVTPGAITVAGQDVALNAGANVTLAVTAGAVSIAGQSIALNLISALGAGALTLSGQSVGLNLTSMLSAGAITVAGQDIALSASGTTTLPVTGGAISIAGQELGLQIVAPLSAGALSIAGQSVGFGIIGLVQPGSITINGQNVTLSLTGALDVRVNFDFVGFDQTHFDIQLEN